MGNIQHQPGTTTAINQNLQTTTLNDFIGRNEVIKLSTSTQADASKKFSFTKKDVDQKKRGTDSRKDESSLKHGSLICLKNVKTNDESESIGREYRQVLYRRKSSN
jgi:hypothetical protein